MPLIFRQQSSLRFSLQQGIGATPALLNLFSGGLIVDKNLLYFWTYWWFHRRKSPAKGIPANGRNGHKSRGWETILWARLLQVNSLEQQPRHLELIQIPGRSLVLWSRKLRGWDPAGDSDAPYSWRQLFLCICVWFSSVNVSPREERSAFSRRACVPACIY